MPDDVLLDLMMFLLMLLSLAMIAMMAISANVGGLGRMMAIPARFGSGMCYP